jgi:hypothetical protein
VAGTQVKQEVSLVVRSRQIEPSDTLVIRNFRFFKDENDTRPAPGSLFHPGETLWAKFDITGYKLAEKNHMKVQYGLSVLSTEDEVLFEQADAALEEDTSFYPKRYVPGVLSLSLQPDLAKGNYVLAITAKDLLGDQEYTAKQTFTVQ